MKRKETYATTGSRMTVRFFGGWDFDDEDTQTRLPAEDRLRQGRAHGRRSARTRPDGKAPDLPGRGHEGSLQRQPRPHPDRQGLARCRTARPRSRSTTSPGPATASPVRDGKVPPVGNTVDVANATWTNTIGAPELIAVWTDPDFDPAQRAFYYARVIEIPTPRWTAYEAQRFGIEMPEEVPMTTQERAYTSPIWYTPSASGAAAQPVAMEGQYGQDSWKTRISESCLSFFDGCNNCRRNPQTGIAACTRKACARYAKPVCLDDTGAGAQMNAPASGTSGKAHSVTYSCESGARVSADYGEYVADDQRLKLKPDEIMFRDHQTHTAALLARQRSASGERYGKGGLVFWAKGDEAFVLRDGDRLYTNCVRQ